MVLDMESYVYIQIAAILISTFIIVLLMIRCSDNMINHYYDKLEHKNEQKKVIQLRAAINKEIGES